MTTKYYKVTVLINQLLLSQSLPTNDFGLLNAEEKGNSILIINALFIIKNRITKHIYLFFKENKKADAADAKYITSSQYCFVLPASIKI